MRQSILLFIIVLLSNPGCSQPREFKKFLDSFTKESSSQPLNFGKVVQYSNRMTKHEALEFVYRGDTSKLYCKQQIFNMETEKVEGISTELYLPDKCLRLDTDDYYLIAYNSYDCQAPNKPLTVTLVLKIINKKYKVTDSLVVYKGTDYDWEMTGLINPHNNKIFVLNEMSKKTSSIRALIYRINDSLKFEIFKDQSDIKNMTDDLEKDLELLSWQEAFLN